MGKGLGFWLFNLSQGRPWVGSVTNGGDVLNEGIVLDGEVVGGDGLAQTLATLEEFLKKITI